MSQSGKDARHVVWVPTTHSVINRCRINATANLSSTTMLVVRAMVLFIDRCWGLWRPSYPCDELARIKLLLPGLARILQTSPLVILHRSRQFSPSQIYCQSSRSLICSLRTLKFRSCLMHFSMYIFHTCKYPLASTRNSSCCCSFQSNPV